MEIIIILMLFAISIELWLILCNVEQKEKKTYTDSISKRRETEGMFKENLNGYRVNKQGQYIPIKPNSNPYAIRPHLGDDDNNEV